MKLWVLLSLVAAVLVNSSSSSAAEAYTEQLILSPLPDGKLLSSFEFTLTAHSHQFFNKTALSQPIVAHHHTLLPPVLLSILRLHSITSFRLTLSAGRWSPHWPASYDSSAASGIEVSAWLQRLDDETLAEEEQRWNDFTSALGGLFCAGIIGGARGGAESSPGWGYLFEGFGERTDHSLYRSLIPRLSATCTESLTPFISLLPCNSHAGLASLLNPHTLFDGDWTLIGVSVVREEEDFVKIELQVGSVADPIRKDRLKGGLGRREFSFSSLYDRTLSVACPVASESLIKLGVPLDSVTPFTIDPSEGQASEKGFDGDEATEWAIWNTSEVSKDTPLDVRLNWPHENQFHYPHPSKLPITPITARRLLKGQGQERGRIGIELTNHEPLGSDPVEVVWVESWPWWVRGFISTLDATDGSQNLTNPILSLSYSAPIPRQKPTTIQALVQLHPQQTLQLTLSYESSYLWYTEYPPDAHRGFEIPGALVVLLSPLEPFDSEQGEDLSTIDITSVESIQSRNHRLKIHTPSTLLSLPTPDFSMPYNVIILTSTVIALFFGSVMNALVRGSSVVAVDGEESEKEDEKKGVVEDDAPNKEIG